MYVQVHLHVGISAGHACGLRVLVTNLEVFLQFAHAPLPHFLGQKLRDIRNRVAVLLGFLLRVGGDEKFSLVDGALEPSSSSTTTVAPSMRTTVALPTSFKNFTRCPGCKVPITSFE